jgi:hypothetical protein
MNNDQVHKSMEVENRVNNQQTHHERDLSKLHPHKKQDRSIITHATIIK